MLDNNKNAPKNRYALIIMLCIIVCTALVFVLPKKSVYGDELREKIQKEEEAVKAAAG